jgi:hypothetical protein
MGNKASRNKLTPQGYLFWLPKARQRFYGLSRTTILELCLAGKVRSKVIAKAGAKRGIRLFFVPSLNDYLMAG